MEIPPPLIHPHPASRMCHSAQRGVSPSLTHVGPDAVQLPPSSPSLPATNKSKAFRTIKQTHVCSALIDPSDCLHKYIFGYPLRSLLSGAYYILVHFFEGADRGLRFEKTHYFLLSTSIAVLKYKRTSSPTHIYLHLFQLVSS